MVKSMTGFASASGGVETMRWDWEIRGVNGKGLDLRLRLPEGADALEPVIRKTAAGLKRGSVTVSLRVHRNSGAASGVLDSSALSAALDALRQTEEAAMAAGVDLARTTAAGVLALPGVMRQETERAALPAEIAADIPALFAEFDDMRRREGAALRGILETQLDQMATLIDAAAKTAEARDARAGVILKERVAALLEPITEADPARLSQELALLAVKSDVTEEIDRLRAHVDAARQHLSEGGVLGRKLDFLMQEFNREANTLCSKAGSTDLTALGLELKVIIDQMREQVQNLE